jgi:hypothetical protein
LDTLLDADHLGQLASSMEAVEEDQSVVVMVATTYS